MAHPKKVAVVDEIAEKIKRTQSLFLTDFSGLDVGSINELRLLLRKNSVEYLVVKNTLARLAVDKAGREDLKPYLVGPTAMAFGFEDPVLPAKLLSRFAQKTGKPSVKAILFEGQIFGQEAMGRLETLRSREELLVQMVSDLKAPMAHAVMVLGGLLRNLVGLLEAISRAKGEGEGKGLEESVGAKVEEKDEAKVEEIAEEKTEAKAEKKVEEKAEEMKDEEQKPTEEAKPKLTEEQFSEREPEDHKAKAADSPQPKKDKPEEVKPENDKREED